MILSHMRLGTRANVVAATHDVDNLADCQDQQHWRKFSDDVRYVFNSRGFRDAEWPDDYEELSQAIWCLGDSYTVGVGSAYHNTWPQILQQVTGRRCINVSMGGASNVWIARQAFDIVHTISPKTMVIQWSYLHRDEISDVSLSDEQRRIPYINDISTQAQLRHFTNSIDSLRNVTTKIVHAFVPNAIPDWPTDQLVTDWENIRGSDWPTCCPQTVHEFQNLPKSILHELQEFQLYDVYRNAVTVHDGITEILKKPFLPPLILSDLARDGYHYDVKTATGFVADVVKLII